MALAVGDVHDGYRYVGGDPNTESSWARVEAQTEAEQSKGAVRDFAAGANRTITGLAGLPVDAATALLNIPLPPDREIQNPVGGSESLRSLWRKGGIETEGPRNVAGMAGEYLALSPLIGPTMAARAGLSPTMGFAKEAGSSLLALGGGLAGRAMAPDNPFAELLGAMAPAGARAGLARIAKPAIRGVPVADVTKNQELAARVGAPQTAAATIPSKPIQTLAGASSSTPGGVSTFRQAGEDAAVAMRRRVARIVGGEARDTAKAGRLVRKGLFDRDSGWVARTKAVKDDLYSRLDEKIYLDGMGNPRDGRVYALNARQFMGQANQGMAGSERLSQRLFVDKEAQALFDDLAADLNAGNSKIPYDAIKKLRTHVDDLLGDPELIGSTRRTLLSDFRKSLTADMETAARDVGALKEFNRANTYNRVRSDRITDYLERVDRKVGGQEVYTSLIGNNPQSAEKLATIRKSLNPDEWQYVRRTIVSKMGEPVASAGRHGGPGFSAKTFLTNYNKMVSNGTAKQVFGTGQFRRDLDDVANYASNLEEAADLLANPSGTGARGLTASILFYGLGLVPTTVAGAMMGDLPGAVAGAVTGGAAIVGGIAANRSLALKLNSPEFVHWLATATKIPAARLPGHIARLGAISVNDPELGEAIASYADWLSQYNPTQQ